MNVYDTVQSKASEIAGLISLTLGLCLITASCWLLHRTISSESLVYYSYGLKVGGLKLESTTHMDAYHFLSTLVSPYVTVLKIAASLAIIGGMVQVGSCLLTFKTAKQGLRIWLAMSFAAFVLSLVTLILPVAYRLTHSMETKILITIASVNALMLVHLFVVVYIQFKRMETVDESSNNSSDKVEDRPGDNASEITSSPSVANAQALAANAGNGNRSRTSSASGRSSAAIVV